MGADFSLLRALQQPFDRIVNAVPSPPTRPPAARRHRRLHHPPAPHQVQASHCDRSTWLNTLRNRSNVSPNRHVMLARLASRLGRMRACRRVALIQQLKLSTSVLCEMRRYLKRNAFVAKREWVDDWHTLSLPRAKRRCPPCAKSVSFAQYAELRFFHA